MNYLVLLTILSSICSIVSLIISVCSKYNKAKTLQWVVVVFALTFSCGYAVHYNSELERIRNIHRQANTIYEHYNPYSTNNDEFIQESLVFLEENKDRYYEAYMRAYLISLDAERPAFRNNPEPAKKICGIIKGIATLNNE